MNMTFLNTRITKRQKGFALIEVLVSMILLAIGIIALLSTQIRSVAGVREAEGQTIVANAAQNLIEGMLANPVVNPPAAGTEWKTKSYASYETPRTEASIDNACDAMITDGDIFNKNNLSALQICQFQQTLSNNLQDARAEFRICRDSGGNSLEVSRNADGSVRWPACNGTGDTLIQVVWQAQPDKEGSLADSPLYTFQARVTD